MRIFTDGAEMGDMLFWSYSTGLVNSTNNPRSGNYCYGYESYYAAGTSYKDFTNSSEIYLRFAHWTNASHPNNVIMAIYSSGNQILYMNTDGGGYQTIRLGGGGIGSTTIPGSFSTWCLYEVYFKLADAGGRIIIKLDGNTAFDYTGDTNPSTYTGVNRILITHDSGNLYYDDFALNNTDNSDGKGDISWCGDGRIVKITPSGSGITNDWLNNGGVSGSANYLYVDEYPNDGDTTYVYASSLFSGCQTNFAMSNNFDGTNKTITRIYAEGRARKTYADNYGIKIGTIASGGTNVLSGSQILAVGAYSRVVGPEAKVNPVTSASWVKADIDGLEFVTQIP